MKQILTICMTLISLVSYSQDTLCTMVTLDEIIVFDYVTSEVINRVDHDGEYTLHIDGSKVMCLHLCDEKKRYRDVTTTFDDGDNINNTFSSSNNSIYTREEWGDVTIRVSKDRRRK